MAQTQILKELRELKYLLSKLIGTADLAPGDQFSEDALNRAAKAFQKLRIEAGEWVKEDDINKYIKKAPWGTGSFIKNEFGFTNFIRIGHCYYYSRKDLISIGNALKKRNIDLGRYMELRQDQIIFAKKIAALFAEKKQKSKRKPYQLPQDLTNITTTPPPLPSADIVRKDILRLKEEFFQYKLSDYIDIYKDNHALMKFIYHFEKYLEPGLKRRCKKWCDDFNYANHALELITKKKETFVPVRESDMIEL